MKKLITAITMFLCACTAQKDNDFTPGSYKLINSLNNTPITITFAKDGKLNGKVVNYLMGEYKIDPDSKISFGPIASTMMMGPQKDMEAEQFFLQNLQNVKSYKIKGNRLILTTEDGSELMFEPDTPPAEIN